MARAHGIVAPVRRRIAALIFYAFAVIVAAAAGGIGLGILWRQAQMALFASEADEALRISDPALIQDMLPRLQARWAHLSQHAMAKAQMASIYLHAADRLPRQHPYGEAAWREASAALAALGDSSPLMRLQAIDLVANAAMLVGREQEAWQALHAAEKELLALPAYLANRWRTMHNNNLAYLCATAVDPSLRDPARARALAEAVVRQPPMPGQAPTSENAAFLDTLAEACYANGDYRQALVVQRLALARAGNDGDLAVYLKHYDKYRAAGDDKTKDSRCAQAAPAEAQ